MESEEMGGISTFQATTVTTTSICILFFLFIRSSSGECWEDVGVVQLSHTADLLSTAKSLALEVVSTLESSRRPECRMHRLLFRCKVWPARSELISGENRP